MTDLENVLSRLHAAKAEALAERDEFSLSARQAESEALSAIYLMKASSSAGVVDGIDHALEIVKYFMGDE